VVMPHALMQKNDDLRAEADIWLPTSSASALSTPDTGVNSEKHRTRRRYCAIPTYSKEWTDRISAALP